MSDQPQVFDGEEGFLEWAELQVKQAQETHRSFLDQHAALYRWILAARLSVNGGAAVALMAANGPWSVLISLAMLCFVVGAIFAILAAEFDQEALEAGIAPNLAHLGFWVKARATNQYDAAKMNEIMASPDGVKAKQRRGKVVGWGSLVVFVIGALLVGFEHAEFSLALDHCPGSSAR